MDKSTAFAGCYKNLVIQLENKIQNAWLERQSVKSAEEIMSLFIIIGVVLFIIILFIQLSNKTTSSRYSRSSNNTPHSEMNIQRIQDLYIQASAKHDRGDFVGAIKDITQILHINPNDSSAYTGRALFRSDMGDIQGAIADYTQALRIDPNDDDAYYMRGVERSTLEDNQGALDDYTQALRINPNHKYAYALRGYIRHQLNDEVGAIEDYNRALQVNPNPALIYFRRGESRQLLKDYQGALKDFQKAAALFLETENITGYESSQEFICYIEAYLNHKKQ